MRTLLFLGVSLLILQAAPRAHAAPLEVMGWIPYWRAASVTADVIPHMKDLTTVMPFGYIVQNDGTLYDAFGLGSATSSTTPIALALRASAKANKVKFIPTVMWSNSEAIHAILRNQKTRIALEDRIADLVKSQGFDGINIDFENKKAETKEYFSTFLKGLYMRMGQKWVYCAIEARTPLTSRYEGTPPAAASIYANDYVAIAKYCDRVQLMTYDQQTIDVRLNKEANGTPYVPVADTRWVEKTVQLAAQTIPKKKLHIGIATYGYEWRVTPLTISGYRYDMEWAFNPRYATELAASLGITPQRNAAGELSFTYRPSPLSSQTPTKSWNDAPTDGTFPHATTSLQNGVAAAYAATTYNILWWSDAQAVADKVALAKKLGVRGVAVFKFDGGQDPGIWDVLPKK